MLARWNPFNGEIFREADSLFRGAFLNDFAAPRSGWTETAAFVPAADVLERENEILVKVDLPGHDPKSVQVKMEDGVLTIQSERKQEPRDQKEGYLRAERSFGAFARSFALPDTVDAARVEAHFDNGVLTLTLPKREETKPRTISVKVQ